MQPTVLLVEDDEAFRYAAARHLTQAGFHVVEARDTIQALERHESGLAVDCLVADLQMPTGVPHGLSLATMLRSRKPSLVVIFVTAYADLASITREHWGADVVFSKPVELNKLATTIKDTLAERAASEGER